MKLFPLSYYSIFLVILYFISKKKASYFYPFMIASSLVGGISIFVGLTYPEWDKKQEKYVKTIPFDFSYKYRVIFNLIILFFKILVLIYWPVNRSYKAYLISFLWVLTYLVIFRYNLYLNKYNGRSIGDNTNI